MTASHPLSDTLSRALDLLAGRPLVVLGGAGMSTDSGIPDYRGVDHRRQRSPVRTPMTIAEFRSGPLARRRYWARSHLGWSRMREAQPNAGHQALAMIDPHLLITQNVDGLHEAAGSRRVVALHGRISEVVCLDCRARSSRAALQETLHALNPDFSALHARARSDDAARPDGDTDLEDPAAIAGFVVPGCAECGGVLKPDVVFFGENVPAERVQRCYDAVDSLAPGAGDLSGGALMVAGSSLTVMSGLRFVKRAARLGVPIVIVNRGATRGDPLAAVKVDTGCSEFLRVLTGGAPSARADVGLAGRRAPAGRGPSPSLA